jgi:hypothetical protein
MIFSMQKKRESIDEMIDAHCWMRAVEKRRAKRRRRARDASKKATPTAGRKSPPPS